MSTSDDPELDPEADPESVARTICLRLLDQRSRTRSELAKAMRKRNVPDEIAERVLDRYTDVGLIDDTHLADTAALALHRERGLARRAVAQKLRQRGLDDDTIGAAVDRISGDSERDAARALAQKRLRTMSGLAPDVQARRLVGFLGRKGYPPGLCFEIVRELIRGAAMEHSADSDGIAALADL